MSKYLRGATPSLYLCALRGDRPFRSSSGARRSNEGFVLSCAHLSVLASNTDLWQRIAVAKGCLNLSATHFPVFKWTTAPFFSSRFSHCQRQAKSENSSACQSMENNGISDNKRKRGRKKLLIRLKADGPTPTAETIHM